MSRPVHGYRNTPPDGINYEMYRLPMDNFIVNLFKSMLKVFQK